MGSVPHDRRPVGIIPATELIAVSPLIFYEFLRLVVQKLVEIVLVTLVQVTLERLVDLLKLALMSESLLLLVPLVLLALVVEAQMLTAEVIARHHLVVRDFSSVFEAG